MKNLLGLSGLMAVILFTSCGYQLEKVDDSVDDKEDRDTVRTRALDFEGLDLPDDGLDLFKDNCVECHSDIEEDFADEKIDKKDLEKTLKDDDHEDIDLDKDEMKDLEEFFKAVEEEFGDGKKGKKLTSFP